MDRRLLTLLIFSGVLLVVVLAVVVGRGGDDSDDGSTSADSATKPTVEVPEGEPPAELVSEDLETGDGDEAETGDSVTVQYVGVDFETGEEFDSSWDRGEPFPFQLGSGQVIPGWDEGVVGMKVGGQRTLTIPPDYGYGARGAGGVIPPNATLVFDVELLDVR